ncbi:flavodoxin [Fusobacterium sp.]|uniref:flavodoxin n=1 Tax=Fusobacterium sp. TaxID=68766 RepID=UPI002620BD91|nr:flavodoxin [Fusobacterium sp.]
MKKIGVFYGSTSGTTLGIVDEVEFYLKKMEYDVINVADGIASIGDYENLILITPTYGVGELQADWENVFDEFSKVDFSGKVVGLIGLGNQYAFGESFVGSIKVLYDVVTNNGGKVVGFTSTEGYHYEESEAVIDDQFVGLAIDEGNQGDHTPDKIKSWIEEILPSFN